MYLTLQFITYTPIVFCLLYLLVNFLARTPHSVCIVVLGDIGRSPRMQYHALSFAKEGFKVYLVGYKGSIPLAEVLNKETISLHHLWEPPAWIQYCPRLMTYGLKVLWQTLTLAWTLLLLPKTSATLLQNPPSLPAMLVVYAVCCVRFSEMVIDWHNYGYSILAMALTTAHPLVKISKWYERLCGRLASHNICVTQAMQSDLAHNWNIRATTVYDRPAEIFRSVSVTEQHELFLELAKQYPIFKSRNGESTGTLFTGLDENGQPYKLTTRPALLVSSTSWTEDEDFGILLEALKGYDTCSDPDLPDVCCVITGKGPQKDFYKNQLETMQWNKVSFCLPWLTAEDYPLLLGSADLGVCLHTSSSGLDLPMKVVDMFGTGLPVCAVNFNCIDELVQHEKNGLVFSQSDQLRDQLKELLGQFPKHQDKLKTFRSNLETFQTVRWHDQWQRLVLPIFLTIGLPRSGRKMKVGLSDKFEDFGFSAPQEETDKDK